MSEPTPEQGRKRLGGILWWVASSLVLVLLVVGGTFLALRGGNSTPVAANGTDSSAPTLKLDDSESPSAATTAAQSTAAAPAAEPTARPTGLVVASPNRQTPVTGRSTGAAAGSARQNLAAPRPNSGLVVNPVTAAQAPLATNAVSSNLVPLPLSVNSALSDLAPVQSPLTVIGPAVVTPIAPAPRPNPITGVPARPNTVVAARPANQVVPIPVVNNPIIRPVFDSTPAGAALPVLVPAPAVIVVPPPVLAPAAPSVSVGAPTSRPVVVPTVRPQSTGTAADRAPVKPAAVSIKSVGTHGANVTWVRSLDDKGVRGYVLNIYSNSTLAAQLEVDGDVTEYTFTDWSPGTEYRVGVQAIDTAKQYSSETRSNTVTTVSAADNPPKMTGAPKQDGKFPTWIRMSWPAATDDYRVAYYTIYSNGTFVGRTAGTETQYTLTQVKSASSYKIEVRAVDTSGQESAAGTPVTMTTEDAAPGKPRNASVRNVNSTTATLIWSPAADDTGIDFYTIYSVASNGTLVEVARVSAADQAGDQLTHQLTGLTAGTLYRYAIQATDIAGQVSARPGLSDYLNFTTPAVESTDAPPSAPGAIRAAPIQMTWATIGWAAATDDRGVSRYNVYLNGSLVGSVVGNQNTFYLANLAPGQRYTVGVQAIDTAGQAGALTTTLITTLSDAAPTAPKNVTETKVTATSAEIVWEAASDDLGVKNYIVKLNGKVLGTTPASVLSFPLRDLTRGRSYVVEIVAVDTSNQRSVAASKTFNTSNDTPPEAAKNLRVAGRGFDQITVAWDAAIDDNGPVTYFVMVDGRQVMRTGNETRTAVLTGLNPNAEYDITVIAEDSSGQRTESAVLRAGTLSDAAPKMTAAPRLAIFDSTSVIVRWDPATDDKGVVAYQVFRDGELLQQVDGDKLEYLATGLEADTKYTFTVLAIDTIQQPSAPSEPAEITMPARDNPPSTPGGLKVTAVKAGSIGVAWTAATDDYSVAAYRIYVDGALRSTVSAETLSYVVQNLRGSTKYTIEVRAMDSKGQESEVPATIAATTTRDQPPSAPQSFRISSMTAFEAIVVWDAATDDIGISRYDLYAGSTRVGNYSNTFRQATLKNLRPNTRYTVNLVAVDSSGRPGPSARLTFTTPSIDEGIVTPFAAKVEPVFPTFGAVTTTNSDATGDTATASDPSLATEKDPVRPLVKPTSRPAPLVP